MSFSTPWKGQEIFKSRKILALQTQVSSHLQVPVLQCLGHLDVLFFSLPSVTGTFRAINYGLIPTQMGGLHSADHDLDIVPSDAESP